MVRNGQGKKDGRTALFLTVVQVAARQVDVGEVSWLLLVLEKLLKKKKEIPITIMKNQNLMDQLILSLL